jgi:hypothetical protein
MQQHLTQTDRMMREMDSTFGPFAGGGDSLLGGLMGGGLMGGGFANMMQDMEGMMQQAQSQQGGNGA